MSVNSVTQTQSIKTTTNNNLNDQLLDPTMFLKLLMTQMKNQDPTSSSQDPTAQVAQLAQFAVIEQLNQLNSAMQEQSRMNTLSEGSQMIGKKVTVQADENQVEGIVEKVRVVGGEPLIIVNGNQYQVSQVIEVKEA